FTKSGIMVGLGESREEVLQLMDDLRSADVDFMTIGQYLQPTPKHHVIDRFVTPEEFKEFERRAFGKGFLMVSASPLTRSSYHAGEDFARMRAAREAKLAEGGERAAMPTHAERRRLPYRPEQLYDLVADVERYPAFLPWCLGARIKRREGNTLIADLVIGFKMIRERFTSRVVLHDDTEAPNLRIDVTYVQGPFKYL